MFNSGIRGRRASDGQGIGTVAEQFVQQQYPVPRIDRFAITDGSYVDSDNTAADPAGGETIVLYGSGFQSGATVVVGTETIGVVTVLDSGRIAFTAPALSSGSYTVYVRNPSGGTAALVPGIVYSAMPAFSTAAGNIGIFYETTAVSSTVVATEGADPITYTLASGTLPPGATLNSNGTITGTTALTANSTTYTFTIRATDAELQDSTRQFTITINPDVVTWSLPAEGAVYDVPGNVAISNVTLSASSAAGYPVVYSANAFPTGISLSGHTISGTPTAEQTITTLLTATANTTTRSATRTISWIVRVNDPFFDQTVLALTAEPEGNIFVRDFSTNNFAINTVGDTRPNRMSPYWPAGWSAYFDGTGDQLTTPSTNGPIQFGTNPFTIEFWIYPSAVASRQALVSTTSGTGTGPVIAIIATGAIGVGIYGSADVVTTSASSLAANQWQHVAIVRSSTSANDTIVYINGISRGTGTLSTNFSTAYSISIGQNGQGSEFYTGYISNLRILKGTALYTANFTPSTTALTTVSNTSLLTLRDPVLADDSPNNFTITRNGDTRITTFSPFNTTPYTLSASSNSVYFDGTGDYLVIPNNNNLNLGSGDYTFECWIYWTATQNIYKGIFGKRANNTGWTMALSNTNPAYMLFYYSGGGNNQASNGPISPNVWTHIAWVKRSGTVYYYVNGQQVHTLATGPGDNNYDTTIGVSQNVGSVSEFFDGYISNARFVKGTAVYTANFTPATTALTSVANTSLLACQNTTITDNSTNNFTITVNGDARSSTVNPFSETATAIANYSWSANSYSASAYLDGTADVITVPANGNLTLGTQDHTVEFWMYQDGAQGAYATQWKYGSGSTQQATNDYYFQSASAGGGAYSLLVGASGSWGVNISAGATYYTRSLNNWTHVAWSRQGSTWRLFFNGQQVGTATYNANITAQAGAMCIGASTSIGTTDPAKGYFSNFRMVIGQAVYTGPFVPPAAPLTTVANTAVLTLQSDIGTNSVQFVDQSSLNHLVTRSGNAAQGSFSPYLPDCWSVYLDGTGDYVTLPAGYNTAMGGGWVGSTNKLHTLECWVYPTAWNSSNSYEMSIIGQYAGVVANGRWKWVIVGQASGNGKLKFYWTTSDSVGAAQTSANTNIPLNAWTHIAMTVDATTTTSTTIKFWVNGQLSDTFSGLNFSSQTANYSVFSVGGNVNGSNAFQGYISNFRQVYRTLLYTETFTPSTTSLLPINGTALLLFNSASLLDNSPSRHALTRAGDIRTTPFSPFAPHTHSNKDFGIFLDGTGDVLRVDGSGSVVNFGTDNFSIEFYFLVNSLAGAILDTCPNGVVSPTNRIYIEIDSSGTIRYKTYQATTTLIASAANTIKINTWHHFYLGRNNGSTRMFIDGSQVGSTYADSLNYPAQSNRPVFFANGYDTSGSAKGIIFQPVIRKGPDVSPYTTNFFTAPFNYLIWNGRSGTALAIAANANSIFDTVSPANTLSLLGDTRPIRLCPDGDASGIDTPFNAFYPGVNTTLNVEYTPSTHGGSAYLDGNGDQLSISDSDALNLSSGDWTIEYWIYCTALTAGNQVIFNKDGQTSVSYPQYTMSITSAGVLQAQLGNGNGTNPTVTTYTGSAIAVGAWNHVALVKTGTTIKIFQNGIQTHSSTQGIAMTDGPRPLNIGFETGSAATAYFNGYISNFRIIKGTALYTVPFAPPIAPTSATTANTSLLLNFTSSGVFDATGRTVFESAGDAKISRFISKNGTHSLYFDGTGDYLAAPSNVNFNFDTGDFTIECYVNWTTVAADKGLVSRYTSSTGWALRYSGLGLQFSDGDTGLLVYATTPATNTWYHYAVTRSGTNLRMFIDGVLVASATNSTNLTATNPLYIGTLAPSTWLFNGYIDDVRITKGVARYTANFTPPSQLLLR